MFDSICRLRVVFHAESGRVQILHQADSSLNLGVNEGATCGLEQLVMKLRSTARMNAARIVLGLCHGTFSSPD
jgi:hypothetical protein